MQSRHRILRLLGKCAGVVRKLISELGAGIQSPRRALGRWPSGTATWSAPGCWRATSGSGRGSCDLADWKLWHKLRPQSLQGSCHSSGKLSENACLWCAGTIEPRWASCLFRLGLCHPGLVAWVPAVPAFVQPRSLSDVALLDMSCTKRRSCSQLWSSRSSATVGVPVFEPTAAFLQDSSAPGLVRSLGLTANPMQLKPLSKPRLGDREQQITAAATSRCSRSHVAKAHVRRPGKRLPLMSANMKVLLLGLQKAEQSQAAAAAFRISPREALDAAGPLGRGRGRELRDLRASSAFCCAKAEKCRLPSCGSPRAQWWDWDEDGCMAPL